MLGVRVCCRIVGVEVGVAGYLPDSATIIDPPSFLLVLVAKIWLIMVSSDSPRALVSEASI